MKTADKVALIKRIGKCGKQVSQKAKCLELGGVDAACFFDITRECLYDEMEMLVSHPEKIKSSKDKDRWYDAVLDYIDGDIPFSDFWRKCHEVYEEE